MRLLDRLFGPVPTMGEIDAEADVLAATWKAKAARLPRGLWTYEEFRRFATELQGDCFFWDYVMSSAVSAGHLRDLGIGSGPAARSCGLHGSDCELS